MDTLNNLRTLARNWVVYSKIGLSWVGTKAETKKKFIEAVRAARPADVAHALIGSDVMRFELSDDQYNKANKWFDSIFERDKRHAFDYGAIGGGLSFEFTQTGLGVIVVAKEALSGETLNLTDFTDW